MTLHATQASFVLGRGATVNSVVFGTPTTESSGMRSVHVDLYDFENNKLTQDVVLTIYLATSAGIFDAGTTATAITSGGNGLFIGDIITKSMSLVQVVNGELDLDITDLEGDESLYLTIVSQLGEKFISDGIAFAAG